ncbi:MAG: preprotein translocase subunit YajC [Gammaproteobacteria bacterium]|nr:preprotein translocase subunit YajC [Gammaproteobacteria bacterium]
MNFLIDNAWAQEAPAAQPAGQSSFFILLAVTFLFFYVIVIRPQMKRQKEHQKLLSGLSKGDEVALSSGLLGRLTEVGDNYLKVEIAKGVEVKVQKSAISAVLPKGTLKEA